jgi:hypothetical protein
MIVRSGMDWRSFDEVATCATPAFSMISIWLLSWVTWRGMVTSRSVAMRSCMSRTGLYSSVKRWRITRRSASASESSSERAVELLRALRRQDRQERVDRAAPALEPGERIDSASRSLCSESMRTFSSKYFHDLVAASAGCRTRSGRPTAA